MTLGLGSGDEERGAVSARDEHPSVIVSDIARQRRTNAHVVVFANEKGGVGKSTMAFHCSVTLAHLGSAVLAIDCDRRQQSLDRLFEARDGSGRTLQVDLPRPRHIVLDKQSATQLCEEIERVGQQCDFVVIDLPGHDTPIGRRAIALADTVVTPINSSPTDLDALGLLSPVNRTFKHAGAFSEVVMAIRDERLAKGREAFDWVVAKNRVRGCEQRLIASIDESLAVLSRELGFRLATGLSERLAYRDMLPFGLSHLDLKLLPQLGSRRALPASELRRLIEDLHLPRLPARQRETRASRPRGAVSAQVSGRYRDAISSALTVRAAAPAAS
ncbi:MAG: hypothetical protein B7Z33_05730 [Sphingomonadales bacterium 12-68-11]|nr:MAG: hypothetical protein B7Z33_05730 [Sphingomonadales bacterium 12-68-11]